MKHAVFLALALSACSSGQQSASNITAATPSQSAVRSESGYALRSNVEGASFVRLAELAIVSPTPLEPDSYCSERFVQAKTEAGKVAAAKGWRIVQEEKFHALQAVLIVRGFEQMTSGRCKSIDANIAFFEGPKLIGVLYPKGKHGIGISAIQVTNDHLRVWSTDPMAQGQVNLGGANLTFDKVTGSDSVCNGRYRVPAIYGLRYSEARRALAVAGWTPRPHQDIVEGDYRTSDYRKRFPETDSCAGTGYAECRFSLRARDGAAWINIVTLGEDDDPVVSDYATSCEPKRPED
jgi:hypothetical protein